MCCLSAGVTLFFCVSLVMAQDADEGKTQKMPRPTVVAPSVLPDQPVSPALPAVNNTENRPEAMGNSAASQEPQVPQPVETGILYPHEKEVVPAGALDVFFEVKNCALAEGGNALRVVIDNQPPVTLYNCIRPLTLKDLKDGGHTIRAYLIKADGTMIREVKAFAMRHFYTRKKDFNNYIDPAAPFLTVNLPSGDFMDTDADGKVCFDYDVHNLSAGAGSGFKVRYALEGYEGFLAEPGPVYWSNIPVGKHKLTVELFDKDGRALFGIFNKVERVFEVRQLLKAKPFVPGESVPETVPQG